VHGIKKIYPARSGIIIFGVRDNRPLLAVEVKQSDTAPTRSLRERQKWFSDLNPLGIQVVDSRNVLKKYPNNTWVMSVERFWALLN